MRRGGAQAAREVGGDRRAGERRTAAIDDDALVAVAEFEGEGGGAAAAEAAARGRRRGIEYGDGLPRGEPVIAPAARLACGRTLLPLYTRDRGYIFQRRLKAILLAWLLLLNTPL